MCTWFAADKPFIKQRCYVMLCLIIAHISHLTLHWLRWRRTVDGVMWKLDRRVKQMSWNGIHGYGSLSQWLDWSGLDSGYVRVESAVQGRKFWSSSDSGVNPFGRKMPVVFAWMMSSRLNGFRWTRPDPMSSCDLDASGAAAATDRRTYGLWESDCNTCELYSASGVVRSFVLSSPLVDSIDHG